MTHQKLDEPTLRREIDHTFDELEALGFIRRTGEYRAGQPVYTTTDRGREAMPGMLHGMLRGSKTTQ
jgi:hypothetical protein